ncbi:helicase C-terminal domain-containing protein [Pyrobaculum calidifontis]|uniref:Helicase c2 n=1 Tax=Pyrobaculum calidifontis (strain DSM 21063 / JCM 11548 / VA1) TaxID=410359 RepID=A3MXM7_PYRCJ|nr:helicase C-terminal domain-containing protein [Pyrobaculum calidifontis]ABO09394.1 helicase c2 [Pyrobaculum calidifontis JCM 11548]
MRVVLNAPPGFGKSRLLAKLAASYKPSLVFVRSHVEGFQMARYIREFGEEASLLFGRAALCPFGASTAAQCLSLREGGVCKATSKTLSKYVPDVEAVYEAGVCPYEFFHASARGRRVAVLPLAYLSKVGNVSAVADLFEEVAFVALDEVHNFLSVVPVGDDEFYSRRYCAEEGGLLLCLALPLVGELARRAPRLMAASASVVRHFADIFTYFLSSQYIQVEELPGRENLEVEYIPLEIRYRTRLRPTYVEKVVDVIKRTYEQYRRVVAFFPNKELASYYAAKMDGLPVSDKPLGDIDHVVVTYFGSPLSEGVNLSVKAGVLVGFPFPNVKSRELWLKVRLLDRLGFGGYKYGILFTAVNNVVQAAGRVARGLTEERKHIALVDDRFLQYRRLLPSYLQ